MRQASPPGNDSHRSLFLMSNLCHPRVIRALIIKKWHGFCRARIRRLGFFFSWTRNTPLPLPPPPPGTLAGAAPSPRVPTPPSVQVFANALRSVRLGQVPPDVERVLCARLQRNGAVLDASCGVAPTSLYPYRSEVDALNTRKLQGLPGRAVVYAARDSGKGAARRTLESCLAAKEVVLKEGVRFVRRGGGGGCGWWRRELGERPTQGGIRMAVHRRRRGGVPQTNGNIPGKHEIYRRQI